MNLNKFSVLSLFVFCFVLSLSADAIASDVTAGVDGLVYEPGSNVTVSGYVLSSTTHRPQMGAQVSVEVIAPNGTTISAQSKSSNGNGLYAADPFTVSSEGTYTVGATVSGGYSETRFTVEGKKRYTVTTDKYLYAVNETANITLIVQALDSNGVPVAGSSGVSVPVKVIRKSDGSTVKSQDMTTDSTGTATLTYTIMDNSTAYSDYSVVAGNGLGVALFRVMSFSAKAETVDANGANKAVYSSSDSFYLKVIASISTDGGNLIPITSADIKAYVINSAGAKVATLAQYTESQSGTYLSSNYSLSGFTNGEYAVKVDVSKNNLTQSAKTSFKVKTLRVDAVPVFGREKVRAFMKGENATIGLYIVDLSTGNEISGSAITGAAVIECRDQKWKDCLPEITAYNLTDGFEQYSKVLTVGMPDKIGDIYLKIQVNTTSATGIGETYVSLQNIVVFGEIKDSFGNLRWEFSSGETVNVAMKAFGANWADKTISNITVMDLRDSSRKDVLPATFNISNNGNFRNGGTINFTAPAATGIYRIKVKAITAEGDVGYAYEEFKVQKYKIRVDVKSSDDQWRWRFSSAETMDFNVNVMDILGTAIDTSSYKVSLNQLTNEMTGKKYGNSLNITDLGVVNGVPKLRLNLNGLNLDSGFYRAEIKLVDMDGNEDYGNAWFKVSNLDVRANAKKSPSGNYEWQYSPTDNITFEVSAHYFNGTPIAGANVAIEEVLMMQDGPPMPVSTSIYTKANATATDANGYAYLWMKGVSGKTLPQGNQMVMVKVNHSGTVENQEGWYDVRVIKAGAQLERSGGVQSFGKNENVSMIITAKKMSDDSNINAMATILSLKDTKTWNDVDSSKYGASAVAISSSTGTGKLAFSAANLDDGQYEARIRVSAANFTASADVFQWFEVKSFRISGSFVSSKSAYGAGETVSMRITVKYPNGTAMSGANVSVYQFAETERWTFNTQVNNNPRAAVDANGIATVSFSAPSASGRYRPMINITSVSNGASQNAWELPEFSVKSTEIGLKLYTYDSGTRTGTSQQDVFLPNTTAMVNVVTKNPATGEYASVGGVTITKYRNLATQEETELNTQKTSGLAGNDNLTFTTSTMLGDYLLFVKVNTSNTFITEKIWFKVDYNVKFFMNQWNYNKGTNVTINMDSRNPDNTPSNITVELRKLKSWTEGKTYIAVGGQPNKQNISGSGQYIIPMEALDTMYGFNLGDYEAELCVFGQGGSCTNQSRRLYVPFSIQTFNVDAWPWQPSYTRGETVELVFRAHSSGTPINADNFTAAFSGIRYLATDANATANFTLTLDNENWPAPWGESFRRISITPTADTATGEYMATARVAHGSETRDIEVWFKIAGMKLTVNAIGISEDQQRSHRFFVGQNIMLNISTGNSNSYNGTIRIMDEMSWTEAKNYSITITGGNAVQNISIDRSGKYNAMIDADTATESFWLDIGAYDIKVQHWNSMHDYAPGNNVTIKFAMNNLDGTPYNESVNVSVINIRNRWDWSCIGGCRDENAPYFNTTIDMSGAQPKELTFPQSLTGGEYDAELLFSANGQQQRDGFGFNIRTSVFNIWPEMQPGQSNFEPGKNVTFNAFVAYPNGTPAEGVNVSIENIEDPKKWGFSERNLMDKITPIIMSGLTDANGFAQLKFTLNESYTGDMEIAIKENSGNQVNHMMVRVNGYDVKLNRQWNKWRFMPNENYTADVYVYKSGSPAVNVSAFLKSRMPDSGNWENIIYSQPLGVTDGSGHITINYKLDPANYSMNGQYMIEVDLGNGAARVEDWFKVESFVVEERTYGETSYQREVSPGEIMDIDVYVRDANGNVFATPVNATLLELKDPKNWAASLPVTPLEDSPGVYTNTSITDASGRATLKFVAPEQKGEYIARINVTTETDSTLIDAWFKVMSYSVNVEMLCSDGNTSCGDVNLKTAGSPVLIKASATGNISGVRACVKDLKSTFTGTITPRNICNQTNTNESTVSFMAPAESGEYEAIVSVEVNASMGFEFAKEDWRWFRVMGEGSLEMNAWVQPMGLWPESNGTVMVELWNPMQGGDINESKICSSINIAEIKDTYTWMTVKTKADLTTWIEPPQMCGGMPCGPPGVQVGFTVPDLAPGEYEARIEAVCNGTAYQRNSWFQINAFQVSSLMPQKVKANQTVPLWLKITDYNGAPKSNVNVTIKEIRNDWTWDVVKPINQIINPDANGEAVYNLQTPPQAGQYSLAIEVVDPDSGLRQKINRWFKIADLDILVNLSGRTEFYAGEDVTFTVMVRDAMTGNPLAGANMNLNIMGNAYGGPGELNLPQIFVPPTNMNGTSQGNISKNNLSAGEYNLGVNVCTGTKGCAYAEESFVVNNYYLEANVGSIDYNAGDNITVQIQANESGGTPLNSSFGVAVCLENMKMKKSNTESNETEPCLDKVNVSLYDNGSAALEITVPSNVTSGPAVLFVALVNSTLKEVGWAPYLVILHGAGGGANYTFDETGNGGMLEVNSSEMFGVNLHLSSSNTQMDQMVMHLKKTGNAVPMRQMMSGGGPESNKQDMYEAVTYPNGTADLHTNVLARQEPGTYYAFLQFFPKGAGMMIGPETPMMDLVFVNYRVI